VFPDPVFLAVVAGLAILVGAALPCSGWRGLLRNILIALTVAGVAIVGAVLLGAMMHFAVFNEPVMID
jgi:hypothetical protein